MTVEKTLERKLYAEIKKRGGKALKFFCASFTGMPDRMCLLPGAKIFFVELKSTGKKPTPRQKLIHDWLKSLGFLVWVIDRQSQLDEFLNTIDLL